MKYIKRTLVSYMAVLLGAALIREVIASYIWFVRDGKTMTDMKDLTSVEIKDEFTKEVYTYQSWLIRLLERLGIRVKLKRAFISGDSSGSQTPDEMMAEAWKMFDDKKEAI